MKIDRREFLQSTGSLVVLFTVSTASAAPGNGGLRLGNRITINAAGTVDLHMGKVELGQGIGTALAQIAADELGVDFSRMRLMPVDTDYSPNESYTFSSISIQQSGPRVRDAAARGRQHFLERAAKELGADAPGLSVVDGDIVRDETSTGLSYWQLLGDNDTELGLEQQNNLTYRTDHKVVGQSIPRIDIPGKLFGRESFIQDLRLPGMMHARVVRPPAYRAQLLGFDEAPVAALPGVRKVVRDGNFLAVIANREGQARIAANELARITRWDLAEDLPESEHMFEWLKRAESRTEEVAVRVGEGAPQGDLVRAIYQRPYQAHASISPSAGVALFENGDLTVWSHAQGMYPLRESIAHTLELPVERVRCIHMEASGCYGHNGSDDAACDAAALALQLPGEPVRVQWERADEFKWEPFGPAMHIELQAQLDKDGQITRWQHDVWGCPHTSRPRDKESAGNLIFAQHKANPLPIPPPRSIPQPSGGLDRNAVPLYTFAHLQVNKHVVTDVRLRGSSLRSLGAYGNVFAIESFMDEIALRADVDPFDFRIRHLDDQRAIDVLKQLRELSGWANRPPGGDGTGWGVAFAKFKNLSSYMGIVMQLRVSDARPDVQLLRAIAVCDAGLVVSPDGVRAQIEGGIIQSASWTLKEEVHVDSSQIATRDWATYPILRFDEIPEIEVHLIDRPDQKSVGVGETAQGPTAAAISNAVYHATGQRLRRLPLAPR